MGTPTKAYVIMDNKYKFSTCGAPFGCGVINTFVKNDNPRVDDLRSGHAYDFMADADGQIQSIDLNSWQCRDLM